VEHALAVEVGHRRGELSAQTRDGRGGQPPGTLVDQVVEGVARERLEHHRRLRVRDHLVGAHQVGVRQAPQQPPLGQQPPPRARVVGAVRAQAATQRVRRASLQAS
jgi:hypothetical protein